MSHADHSGNDDLRRLLIISQDGKKAVRLASEHSPGDMQSCGDEGAGNCANVVGWQGARIGQTDGGFFEWVQRGLGQGPAVKQVMNLDKPASAGFSLDGVWP